MSSLNVRIVSQLSADLKESWDALVGEESPFLEWDWLASLEEAGCVSAETGWAPHHILVEDDGRLVGACPLYLKGHSEGLEDLAVEMLARGLSVRDIEDAFKDESGRLLLSRTAVSEIGARL